MRTATVVGVFLAVLLLGAVPALACTTPNWIIVEPAGVRGGGELSLQGGGYEAGTVELRWGGLDGDLLGTAEATADGLIEATVSVPETEPGRSRVVGVQEAADGTRLWGFADVAVEAAPAPLLDGWRIAAVAFLLLALAVLAVRLRGMRARREAGAALPDAVDADAVDAGLAELLEEEETAPLP